MKDATPDRHFFDIEQNSERWHIAREGAPTASIVSHIMAGGKKRQTMLYRLAGEIITGRRAESYSSAAMRRGHKMEEALAAEYAFERNETLYPGGFWTYRGLGASPDRLVGDVGLLEIKSKAPHLLIPFYMCNENGVPSGPPAEHLDQVYAQLYVTGREWCDLVVGYTGMPTRRWRLYADHPRVEEIAIEAEKFVDELLALVQGIHDMPVVF